MPRSFRRDLRYRTEYAGLLAALGLVDALPLGTALAWARGCADVAHRLDRRRRETARENVRRAGIASRPAEVNRIARASFRSFALVAVESLKFNRFVNADTWPRRAVMEIPPATRTAFDDPARGIIVCTAHFGNWEAGGRLLSFVTPVTAIARHMNNPYTNRVMEQRNAGTRVKLTPKHDADARRLLRALRAGDALALLIDQHAREHAMTIDFFGRPAATYVTPALLHLRTGLPVVFGCCTRTGPLRFRLTLSKPIEPEPTGHRDTDIRRVLEELTRQLETAIRARPEQYLWSQRRWR